MHRLIAVFLSGLLPALAAQAQTADTLGVELNKLEPRGEDCRAYLVFENTTDIAFSALKLDLVMFDTQGVVARRLAVDAAPLAAGKTSLKVFDMSGLGCDGVGRMLLNDMLACEGPDGPLADCLQTVNPSSRADVPFLK